MRTPIPGALEQRIERVHEGAGYATKSEFVRDAVRHWLAEVEEERFDRTVMEETHFSYSVHSPTSLENHKIELKPSTDSPLDIIYHTPGHPNNTVSFYLNDERINSENIESALSDIQGVAKAKFNTDPAIAVYIPKNSERPFSAIVRDLFDSLYSTIDMVTDGEFNGRQEEKLRRALDPYAERAGK